MLCPHSNKMPGAMPGAMRLPAQIFVTALVLLATVSASAQMDLVYRIAPAYNGRMDTLRMHVWQPTSGHQQSPLMVLVHGGALMSGSYRDLDSTCKRYAERGYVAVTVQYRLGFYSPWPLDPPYTYDRAEIVRACWRGVQDVSAALRYIVDRAQEFNIDTTCITLGGVSAGAILALQTTITDASDSIPNEVFEIADVQRGFDRFPRASLTTLHSDTLNTSTRPLPHISSVVNYYGAIMHPYMLDAKTFPSIVSYHQRNDPVVACGMNRALWGLPLDVGANWPVLWGTCALEPMLEGGGHNAMRRVTTIYDGNAHDIHDPTLIDSVTHAFLALHRCDRATSVETDAILENREMRSLQNDDMNNEAQHWKAFDVLGRELARGTSTQTEARAWIRENITGYVILVME